MPVVASVLGKKTTHPGHRTFNGRIFRRDLEIFQRDDTHGGVPHFFAPRAARFTFLNLLRAEPVADRSKPQGLTVFPQLHAHGCESGAANLLPVPVSTRAPEQAGEAMLQHFGDPIRVALRLLV